MTDKDTQAKKTIELTPAQCEYARNLAEGTAILIRETFCRKCKKRADCPCYEEAA